MRLESIFIFENGDRSSAYPVESDYVKNGIPFWGAKDMCNNKLVYSDELRFISEDKFNSLRSGKLKDNDFVCLLRGGVGKWAQFNINERYSTGFINAQMVLIRVINIDTLQYLSLYLSSPLFSICITEKSTGTAVTQMSASDLIKFLIPLPTLTEQNRIVESIDLIFQILDKLNKY